MGFNWGFVVFLTVFISLYSAMNCYVLIRLSSLLGIKRRVGFYVLLVVLCLSFVLASMLERRVDHGAAHAIYLIAATWMGMLVIFAPLVLLCDAVRLFFKVPARRAGATVVLVGLFLTGYSIINAQRLVVTELHLSCPVSLRAAQLADIHLGSVSGAALARMVEKTNALAPDVVFITGDLLDHDNHGVRSAVSLLDGFDAPVYFVTGNHERYVGVDEVMGMLADTKVKPLRNQAVDFAGVRIVGVDDAISLSRLPEVLDRIGIDDDRYTVLLRHRPGGLQVAAEKGIDLILAGHTHGGQIISFMPFMWLRERYISGLYQQGATSMYVSTGTGRWGPPMRLGTTSEIVLLNLGPQ